ncbi:MAG: Heat-inducible transcription repressor HrcA [uncultured Thiotrichaceae bacterium]|uniref:Heat-inducible transcription repressor HrcA n=1 Tax=uncultured Thiotrichaceae bacterium TaxID=298394 RepID=A0A6S6T0N9_9GAMM|nr:MAG: Heat-inducible transcription repressor HrcA [uncultured Thiotrichaceae bacterium]
MNTDKQPEVLTERAQHILKVLVEGYIQDGHPVGSGTLAKRSGLDLSAATIRNVMADLENTGYIRSPHTSAGRVPTSQGYRLFVDSLVKVQPLESGSIDGLQIQFNANQDTGTLVQSASTILSRVTSLTGLVTIPRHNPSSIRQVEFLRLADNQVLVILVLSRNEVQNRIIQLDDTISADELQQAANFLNECLVGKDVSAARVSLLQEMREHREDMNALMMSAIELGETTFGSAANHSEDDYVIAGETNLMGHEDLSDIDKLRDLFSAFNRKRDILKLLDKSIQAEGVQIFIGSESGYEVFGDCSLVTAPYSIGEGQLGVLGVIGPKRMDYERVIPVVDLTSRLLSIALNRTGSDSQ